MLCWEVVNPIKHTVLYLVHTFLRPLNYQFDQTAEKPAVHNLLHALCSLIDTSYFLASKRP